MARRPLLLDRCIVSRREMFIVCSVSSVQLSLFFYNGLSLLQLVTAYWDMYRRIKYTYLVFEYILTCFHSS